MAVCAQDVGRRLRCKAWLCRVCAKGAVRSWESHFIFLSLFLCKMKQTICVCRIERESKLPKAVNKDPAVKEPAL